MSRAGRPAGSAREYVVETVLFDMDGTLLEAVHVVEAAWRQWAQEFSVRVPAGYEQHGRTAADVVASVVAPDQVDAAVARLSEIEATSRMPVTILPGAMRLVSMLPASSWSIVTSAMRRVALARLSAAGFPVPDALFTAEDVQRGKPDPAPYLLARRGRRAIVFEDSVAGLVSARAAGCIAVGVCGTTPREVLDAHADVVLSTLDDVLSVSVEAGGIRMRMREA